LTNELCDKLLNITDMFQLYCREQKILVVNVISKSLPDYAHVSKMSKKNEKKMTISVIQHDDRL
jgi:hypothetical protein